MLNIQSGYAWKDEDVERLIRYYLSNWRDSTDYDDLCQDARVELFEKWRRAGHQYPLAHLAKLVIPFIPCHWYRSRRCGNLMKGGKAVFTVYPVTDLITEDGDDPTERLFVETPHEFCTLYDELMSCLTPRDQMVAYLVLVEQRSYREIAPMVGLHYTSVKDVWTKSLDIMRRRYGMPVKHPKARKKEANRAGVN